MQEWVLESAQFSLGWKLRSNRHRRCRRRRRINSTELTESIVI